MPIRPNERVEAYFVWAKAVTDGTACARTTPTNSAGRGRRCRTLTGQNAEANPAALAAGMRGTHATLEGLLDELYRTGPFGGPSAT